MIFRDISRIRRSNPLWIEIAPLMQKIDSPNTSGWNINGILINYKICSNSTRWHELSHPCTSSINQRFDNAAMPILAYPPQRIETKKTAISCII